MSTTIFVSLVPVNCPSCKAIFGLTEQALERFRGNGKCFYCPYCQAEQGFFDSREEQLRKQLAREKERHEMTTRSLGHSRRLADRMERSRNALKGVVTKTKNRIKNGVCPCCNRHFKNLERHMKGQHPEYGD